MKPVIKPNTWVLFKFDPQDARMGQVVGASWQADSDGDRWSYYITNPLGDSPYVIPEEDIYEWLDGDEWKSTSQQ